MRRTNTVIKVIGRVNVYRNKLEINAFDLWSLDPKKDNFMEYAHFMLEALYAHLVNTASPRDLKLILNENQREYKQYESEYRAKRGRSNGNNFGNDHSRNQWNSSNSNNRLHSNSNLNANSNSNPNPHHNGNNKGTGHY